MGSALYILSPVARFVTLLCFSRRQEKTVMKLVVDAETERVLGASMCGPDAPEIIQVSICTIHLLLFRCLGSFSLFTFGFL
jgi:hypothetical protein